MLDINLTGGRDLTNYKICGQGKAYETFIELVNEKYPGCLNGSDGEIRLIEKCEIKNKDEYRIDELENSIEISANGTRGLIFGICMLLRKCENRAGRMILIRSISGVFCPVKKIRGHQLGYRPTPNAYDAWDTKDYRKYYIDIMAFGGNTVEHIPANEKQNSLMKYTSSEMSAKCAEIADDYDLDVSLWYPNTEDTMDETLANRKKTFSEIPRIDYVFPPGGDPGDLPADEFFKRVACIKNLLSDKFPNAQVWPSAQAPHSIPDWGEAFIKELDKSPKIDGVIMGPNHAFPIHELRKRVPSKYPIRLYTDITHNVRCEYPVHFDRDDWHFALASTHSRESINPRPCELQLLHRLSAQYGIGTVTYSEGVNDDINKAVWADMDFFGSDIDIKETLRDYSRYFFPTLDSEKMAEIILGMELNWCGDPKNNPNIPNTYNSLCEMNYGEDNWRFNCLMFRAICDLVVYKRRNFELELIKSAEYFAKKENTNAVIEILSTDFDDEYYTLRKKLEDLAETLFKQIGYQLDCLHYKAENPERGALLDTIDQPITDRNWLLHIAQNANPELLIRAFNRNIVRDDEVYFSVALHGTAATGIDKQDFEPYLNFQGDDKNVNNGKIPMCLLNIFDNFTFKARHGGFIPGKNYRLVVTWLDKTTNTDQLKIAANGNIVYEGIQFGGEEYHNLDGLTVPESVIRSYKIPAEYFINGTLELEFSEPEMGVMFAEYRIIRDE